MLGRGTCQRRSQIDPLAPWRHGARCSGGESTFNLVDAVPCGRGPGGPISATVLHPRTASAYSRNSPAPHLLRAATGRARAHARGAARARERRERQAVTAELHAAALPGPARDASRRTARCRRMPPPIAGTWLLLAGYLFMTMPEEISRYQCATYGYAGCGYVSAFCRSPCPRRCRPVNPRN